ncbi:hypothetical protein DXG01_006289 [Tephrocybe rancida]|nr:hypothetical protein DXG01_006289 [Tephrocybe rancida]
MSFEKISDAVDLSHHLSNVAQARSISPLKGLQKYYGKAGMISLAGGLPHPDYFPFASVGGEALIPSSFSLTASKGYSPISWFWNLFSTKEKTTSFQVLKYPARPDDVNLAQSLQYDMASGLPALQAFIKDFTERVYQPKYSNYATLVHTGNTDGWAKAVLTLCNSGEGVLVDEWTYPSAVAMMSPHNIHPVAIPLDGQGVVGHAMRRLLLEWNETARGIPRYAPHIQTKQSQDLRTPRPHIFYTIPVGQNPTGSTMLAARKQEIYDICVEFDIIIVEDDPYYFLQQATYVPSAERTGAYNTVPEDDVEFLSQLVPSYLKFDRQGRVIRLDTFSKVGHIVATSLSMYFPSHMYVQTVAPGSRLGWFTCNPIFAERLERQSETTTQAPCGFGQINLVFDNHPSFVDIGPEALEMKLWVALAEAGVLFSPGHFFAADSAQGDYARGHFRVSFSNAESDPMSDLGLKSQRGFQHHDEHTADGMLLPLPLG